jgi:hypothetical protein
MISRVWAWSAVALVGLALLANPAMAERRALPNAQVTFEIPKGWDAEGDESRMAIRGPKNALALTVSLLDYDWLAINAAELEKELGKLAKGVTLEPEPQKGKASGFDTVFYKGSAKVEDTDIDVRVGLVHKEGGKVVMLVAMGQAGNIAPHDAAIQKILKSVKAAQPPKPEKRPGKAKRE